MKLLLSILAFISLLTFYIADQPKTTAPETKPLEYRLVHSRTGKEMTLAQVADELAARDVVYFGELHDNVAGHQIYAELATLLADRRPDFVLSMEMFERDVQGVVNDYLRGRIDEAAVSQAQPTVEGLCPRLQTAGRADAGAEAGRDCRQPAPASGG